LSTLHGLWILLKIVGPAPFGMPLDKFPYT